MLHPAGIPIFSLCLQNDTSENGAQATRASDADFIREQTVRTEADSYWVAIAPLLPLPEH